MGEWLTIWTAFPVSSGFSFTEGFTEICKIINVGTNLEMSYAMYNTKDQIRRLISWSGIFSVSLRILQDPIQIFFWISEPALEAGYCPLFMSLVSVSFLLTGARGICLSLASSVLLFVIYRKGFLWISVCPIPALILFQSGINTNAYHLGVLQRVYILLRKKDCTW